jgi:hypothetical protein
MIFQSFPGLAGITILSLIFILLLLYLKRISIKYVVIVIICFGEEEYYFVSGQIRPLLILIA